MGSYRGVDLYTLTLKYNAFDAVSIHPQAVNELSKLRGVISIIDTQHAPPSSSAPVMIRFPIDCN